MSKGTDEDLAPDVHVRPNAGIVRNPIDEIKAIRTLLADVYSDAGDGRTLFRELVQNADDAGAQRLGLVVLERGWPDAANSLLRGPALVVANDGAFLENDHKALHKAIGGSKEDEADKIGTFGIGLKSVFHICEALLYMGAAQSEWRAGVLNPWAGTGENGNTDPLHPDWDKLEGADVERLRSVATELLGQANNGLLLWIPMRRPEHLDRGAESRQYGLGERCPRPDDLCAWFGGAAPAALLLAQCGHVRTVHAERAVGPEGLHDRVRLVRVTRPAAVVWVGRYPDDREVPDRAFKGEIVSEGNTVSGERRWSAMGIEARGSESLRQLRSQSDWPQSPQWRNGRYSSVPRKALAHAAVTVLRPNDLDANRSGTRLRWAVFLPLDDDPEPSSSAIVESVGCPPSWEIILHGYFWPSQDRRSIPGVTRDIGNAAGDGDMRIRWNRTLCEELLLSLLPSALANAVAGVDERAARRLLDAVVCSALVKQRMDSVTRRHWLLPIVADGGVRWKTIDAALHAGTRAAVLSIPKWRQAPEIVREGFAAACGECTDDAVFIDDDAPRLADELDDWTRDHLQRLLSCIPGKVFGLPQSLRWIGGVVSHILGPDAGGEDTRAGAVARWLARQIGAGALDHTTRRSASQESRNELREAWRDLCDTLPKTWLVETPVESQRAVAELAAEGVIGERMFPMPFGHRPGGSPPAPQPDQERLDCALSTLGQRLEAGGESGRLQHSRLLLAEGLLAIREARPMAEPLVGLPLLRAIRLPEDREEARSIAELRRQIEKHRVFANPVSQASDPGGADEARPELPSDPKRAVTELAKAIDEAVWLVSGDVVASIAAYVPSPAPAKLAGAVLRARALADPAHRKPLLMRLAPRVSDDSDVRRAARALLAGRAADVVGEDVELFHDPTGNGQALRILLHLLDRSWCAIEGTLVESFSQDILDVLSVRQADHQALHRLLDDCLNKSVNWTDLGDEEALQLLQDLHGVQPEERKRWCAMPLHRGVDGERGALDHQARRSTGTTGELHLPPELESEVRLLEPDSQVADLYGSVPGMDRDGILRLMLEDSRPWRFAERIVRGIRSSDGPSLLPQDRELRDLLRWSRWLPRRDGGALAPDAVLIAPAELRDAVAGVAAAGAFGEKRLPDAVSPGVWRSAEPVVREVLGRPRRGLQIQRMVDALESDRVAPVDGGAWLVLPSPHLVDVSLIEDALQTSLAGSHPGWKIVHAAASVVRREDDGSHDASETLVKLAKALCGSIPAERQIEILTCLADSRPVRDSCGGRLFRRSLESFARTDDFFEHVLPSLDLPTQDGNWHASRDIARTETGVARRHRLIPELRPVLQLDGDTPITATGSFAHDWSESPLETLERYFEPWRGRLPHGPVGAFLSLLGNGLDNVILDLAEQWLGADVSIEGLRSELQGAGQQDPCSGVSVLISPRVAQGKSVGAVNLLGLPVEMGAEPDDDTLFATDPLRCPQVPGALAPLGPFWEISLRDVEPQNRTRSELIRLLGGTVERWASRHLGLPRDRVNAWWSRWGKGSQADFGPVVASIKAHLPLTLQQLDVAESEPLRDALRHAERAQRQREQRPSEATLSNERQALDRLAAFIREPSHQEFLWKRINELMRRYGYEPESVLLELAQNADDALAEAVEIEGGPLPRDTCRLMIRIHDVAGTPTVDFMHWGRPINDTGGAAFAPGRERQWNQDLYFMMLLNLSGKPGEAPGDASPSSTTGRFGLGFKSVHLVSSSPAVVSGFIAFSIHGGLLPREQTVPEDADSWRVEDRRVTRIRLPLRADDEANTLIERLFRRFAFARVLLPVLARQVREVVVEGGPFPGSHVFDGTPIGAAPGWSVGAQIKLPGHDGRWRFLRFRPADAGQSNMGSLALVVGLREDVPTAFGPAMPFLWNVVPTSESWGCGYVVNGSFKLDPGRTHVSLDDDTTLRAVGGLGEALGRGLIELHDVLVDPTDVSLGALVNGDGQGFLSSLWRVLACGLGNPDALRRDFLRELHGSGRGITAWMAARSVVPTGLPAPFPLMLPPLTTEMRMEVASGDFDGHMCAVLAEVRDRDEDLAALVQCRRIVSAEVEQLLLPLCGLSSAEEDFVTPIPLQPSHLFAELAERWDHYLTPERLHALRPIDDDMDGSFDAYDSHGVTWRGALRARAADGSLQPLRDLLLRDALDLSFDPTHSDGEDEFLRAAFAPEDRVLDPAYVKRGEDWRVFRWLRVQHRADAATIAEWCSDLPEDLHSKALHYLLNGESRSNVLQRLIPSEARPHWLRDYDAVRRLLDEQCEESWRRQSLLGALFPDRFPPPEPPRQTTTSDPETFFIHLVDWWEDADVRGEIISAYEKAAWPEWLPRDRIAEGLRTDSADHWLSLLVLGACRSLGRTTDEQHRSFLELAHGEGWWELFKTPDDVGAWMGVLRDWQDDASANLPYRTWMALFPAIFQLSRYREVYVRLLKSAGRRPESMYQVNRLLAPRVDEALLGAGTHFDAPPAPLGIGLHWVLRELVRLEVVKGEHLFHDCWVPSEQVLGLLENYGLERPDDGTPISQKAHAISDFLTFKLRKDTTLHLAFDIPLRYVASNEELQRQFGLEE